MLLIRDIMYCKPGKVRQMVDKFGQPKMRIMTDFCAEQYWTIVAELELKSLDEFEKMGRGEGMSPEVGKEMERIMKDYHDLVDSGRREIYTIEG